ncbi:MAG: RNA-splicing ligase RtcB [delta proteobacterium MLS_D]|jgi:tRNA-splicing ligase RtcB (3'-phosphate/5'-hydroxy nucleic acid ligase)|nr:MAG: RNA-splicing ligase RtcB [delta proteobacterium MLS_D]
MSDIVMERIDRYRWKIQPQGGMRVPGIVYADDVLMETIRDDESLRQVANVAHLPGIQAASLAMPDIHRGYGFPIGGVAAFDMDEGVISPGGVGYDINCGVRLMTTDLCIDDIRGRLKELVAGLFSAIPSGVGSSGPLNLTKAEERQVFEKGAAWAVERGYGTPADLEMTEQRGVLGGADPDGVSDRALERGRNQLGTLGSGNHFLEIEVVDEIFDDRAARAFGVEPGQVVVMIHTGSRGLGYQVCDEYLARMVKRAGLLDFRLPDRQLACAYLQSREGQDYLGAMACAANYAWANRQILMHRAAETFQRVLERSPADIGMRLVYDVCHNIASVEDLEIDGVRKRLCVHRKGATRAYPPGHPDLPGRYRDVGQPVLIPGDMGTGSYLLVGTELAFRETFGSTCHGAGRLMSRSRARKAGARRQVRTELEKQGIIVMATGRATINEEIPEAYKNIEDVVNVVHGAGLSRKVARMRSIGCIKG